MLANFLPIVGLIYSLIVLTDLSYAQAVLKGGLLTDLWDADEAESRAALSGSDGEVRPFITDDARVVGGQLAQIEAWFRADKESGQQWFMLAYGPSDRLELTLGGVFGYERPEENSTLLFSYALPLLQAKYLFREYAPGKPPGVGIVAGSFLPVGRGSFRPPGYGTFGFLTVSQCFGQREDVLIHGNLGANYLHIDGSNQFIHTWGLGTQVRVFGGMHFVGEFISGDPYVPGTGTAYPVGYRHFFSNLFQIDMTLGKGIGGAQPLPLWFSAGIRWVTTRFQRR